MQSTYRASLSEPMRLIDTRLKGWGRLRSQCLRLSNVMACVPFVPTWCRELVGESLTVAACALVPWNANALTPITKECRSGNGTAGLWSLGYAKQKNNFAWLGAYEIVSRCGLSLCKCKINRTAWLLLWQIPFMRPTTPAAGSVCPVKVLMPESMGEIRRSPSAFSINTAWPAPTSIGSPSGVPVPCSSRPATMAPFSPAICKAARIARCCEGPFGAVSELDRPSWLTADPQIAPWPDFVLILTKRSSTATHASPRTYPSALESRALQRPSWASIPALVNNSVVRGLSVTFTPHVDTDFDSPETMLFSATCEPTSEEEHAVSIDTHTPWSPNVYEILPHATLRAPPVAVYGLMWLTILLYSLPEMPTVTPAYSEGVVSSAALICQTASRSMRCCGSIRALSDVEILKASESKASTWHKNPPNRACCISDCRVSSTSHRSMSTRATTSRAPKIISEICVGRLEHASKLASAGQLVVVSSESGKFGHPRASIASMRLCCSSFFFLTIWSFIFEASTMFFDSLPEALFSFFFKTFFTVLWFCLLSSPRIFTIHPTVGKSNTRVAGKSIPVEEHIVFRSSTAPRESNPASRSGSFSPTVFPMTLYKAPLTTCLKNSVLCCFTFLISRNLTTWLSVAIASIFELSSTQDTRFRAMLLSLLSLLITFQTYGFATKTGWFLPQ